MTKIAILIQGPVTETVFELIENCRLLCPASYIVFSTWYSTLLQIQSISCDAIAYTREFPPSYPDPFTLAPDNFELQRSSVLAGLQIISNILGPSTFVIKVRSDAKVNSNLKMISERIDKIALHSRYVISSEGTIDPELYPVLFHFSDLIVGAKYPDMLKLWVSAQCVNDSEGIASIFKRKIFFSLTGFRCAATACEQRLWLGVSNIPDSGFHYDSFSRSLYELHKDLQSQILTVPSNYLGFDLPTRLGVNSINANSFVRTEGFIKSNYLSFFVKRFLYPKRFIYSIFAAFLLLFGFNYLDLNKFLRIRRS